MSLSISALATGLSGFANNQLLKKKEEQAQAREDEKLAYARQFAEDDRSYNRGRNAVADEQVAQTFSQQQLANGLNIAAAQRKDQLDQQTMQRKQMFEGMYGDYATDNIKGLTDKINPLMPSGLNSDQFRRFDVNPDGTATLNTYSKADPNTPIGEGKLTNKENLMAAARAFFDPQGAFEGEISQRAKLAEEQRAAAAENAKAERDHSFKIAEIGAQGQNTRANSLFNAGLNMQRDGANWDRKDAYAQQNPTGTGTASKTPAIQSSWGVNSITQSVMPSLWGVETGGRHTDSSGRLIQSPAGALGIGQLMPGTIRDPGFGITPLRNNSEEENMRVSAQYFQAMQNRYGGDLDLALAAYNAGPGNVDNAIKAAKQKGGDWKKYLPKPSETIPYIAKVKQNMQKGTYEQALGNNVATANQVRTNADTLASQAVIDFKDFEGLNPVAVKTAIIGASRHIEAAVTARTVEDRNQNIDRANDVLKATFGAVLAPQQFDVFSQDTIRALAGDKSFTSFALNSNPQTVKAGVAKADGSLDAKIMGDDGKRPTKKPAAASQAAKPPAAQPNIATIVAATTNAPKPHRMQLDAVKKEIGVIQSAIKSGQASPLQQAKLNERLKDLTRALPDSRHISLSDTVGAVTEPFRFKLQTGLSGGAGSVQSNAPVVYNPVNMEARKQLGL